MILKDLIEQIKYTKISGVRTLIIGDPGVFTHKRFRIELFNGSNIEKQTFNKIEDIPDNLLQATFIKLNIQLDKSTNGDDLSTFEFIVSL
jgi:hypothetical protein